MRPALWRTRVLGTSSVGHRYVDGRNAVFQRPPPRRTFWFQKRSRTSRLQEVSFLRERLFMLFGVGKKTPSGSIKSLNNRPHCSSTSTPCDNSNALCGTYLLSGNKCSHSSGKTTAVDGRWPCRGERLRSTCIVCCRRSPREHVPVCPSVLRSRSRVCVRVLTLNRPFPIRSAGFIDTGPTQQT